MFDDACVASEPLTATLSWISTRGVETRPWTFDTDRDAITPPDHPILYLVGAGVEPPLCTELEDWVRQPVEADELVSRADRLIARSRANATMYTRVDDDDLLRVGDDIVVLTELEARLLRVLIDAMGTLVPRQDLIEAVWPDGPPDDPRALDNRIKAVRKRIAQVPLIIHTVHGRGLVLERVCDL